MEMMGLAMEGAVAMRTPINHAVYKRMDTLAEILGVWLSFHRSGYIAYYWSWLSCFVDMISITSL